MTQHATIDVITSGLTSLVHKKDHEGTLQIDTHTGYILTPMDERPEWAEGLTLAQIAERHKFYGDRLKDHYTAEMAAPEVFAYEDLSWLGAREYPVDAPYINPETGMEEPFEAFIIDADEEHRQEVLANVLGFTATEETLTEPAGWDFADKTTQERITTVDIDMPNVERTAEELEAFERSQKEDIKAINE